MTELLTAAQMRAIEQAAIASGDVTGLELMERAGQGVVLAILAEWPELVGGDHRAVVLCGPGNNGGDGFVVARLLQKAGWGLDVILYGNADKLPPDARVNYERWLKIGKVRPYDTKQLLSALAPKKKGEHVVLVEALFGTGQTKRKGSVLLGLAVDIDDAVTYLRSGSAKEYDATYYCVSVDTPVNANSDTGEADGRIARYDLMVTFHADKVGHVLADIAKGVAKTIVVDIGL